MTDRERDDLLADNQPASEALILDLQVRIGELTAAVAARDAFLATAAHELRNPMTPIVGQVQRLRRLLRANGDPADLDHSLQRLEWLIAQYVKRATVLLDVSRITAGKLKFELAAFDFSELVREVVAAHEPAADYARTIVRVCVPDGLLMVSDRLAVEQILDNLLLNAIKYGAGKPVEISVKKKEDVYRLVVRDHGIGISPEAQARIFQRFERAVTAQAQTGFGIGLWVVQQLVDALGGEVSVDSVPGEGSTFTVTLPHTVGKGS